MVKTSVNSVKFLYQRDYFPRDAISQKASLYKRLQSKKTFHQKDLVAHFGCVNAIDFSNDGKLMTSGGDDRRVLLWDVQESLQNPKNPSPKSMRAQHSSNIFTLAFDSQNKLIYSGGNDDHVIVHDIATGDPLNYYLHERPVYGVSIDPSNDLIFTSAGDDGRVLVFDTRSSEEAVELAMNSAPFHAVMYNPCESRLVATANSKDGIALWDTRKPREMLMQYGSLESCMSIRFNRSGTQLLGLRRRLPPVLYNTQCSTPVAQFDHEGYYNSCTMKSCCFAGSNDEYVVSGSDDFVLYMWCVPRVDAYDQWIKSARQTLEGHRSIVNQVRYNEQYCVLASSGVEKVVKLWSPFPLAPGRNEEEQDPDKPKKTLDSRKVYTHEDYIRLILRNGETFMNHDYSNQSTNEDPRMMAFFDSLVQREIEGWSPTDDSSSDMGGSSPRPFYSYVDNSPTSSSTSSCEEEQQEELTAESFRRRRGGGERRGRGRGAEYFRRRRSGDTETPSARSFRNRIGEEGEEEEEETSTTTSFNRNNNNNSTATPSTSNSNSTTSGTNSNSTTSGTNSTSSSTSRTNNSMILFLTDIVSESSDTSGLPERTRTIIGQSLAARFGAGTEDPPPSDTQVKNPIKELIAQKRQRLMKLAFTPPEKRKRKHLKRLRRKRRDYSSDEVTSPSASDEDSTTRPTSSRSSQSRVRPRYRALSTSGDDNSRTVNDIDENTRDINSNVDEAASTSTISNTTNTETTTGTKRKHSNSNSPESGISGGTTETPDSGIVSDSRTSAVRFNKRLTSSLRSKARCYRNMLRVSSSSDDDDSGSTD